MIGILTVHNILHLFHHDIIIVSTPKCIYSYFFSNLFYSICIMPKSLVTKWNIEDYKSEIITKDNITINNNIMRYIVILFCIIDFIIIIIIIINIRARYFYIGTTHQLGLKTSTSFAYFYIGTQLNLIISFMMITIFSYSW